MYYLCSIIYYNYLISDVTLEVNIGLFSSLMEVFTSLPNKKTSSI